MINSNGQAAPSRRLKVRVGHSYGARYNTQPATPFARIVTGALTPFARIRPSWDNFTLIPPGYDLIHSFNAIPVFGSTPFVVTFEDYCPRVPPDRYNRTAEKVLTRMLLSNRCLAIVAMSEYGLRKFAYQHRSHPQRERLLSKTRVVHPGICSARGTPKPAGDRLKLLFVGTDYLRKGGPAVVRAHRLLAGRGIPVQTTIVSSLRWSAQDYIGPPPDPRVTDALNEVKDTGKAGGKDGGIIWHAGLPHPEVIALMTASDYLLLPTFHDTFGYVGVEAMSVGTPVIATNTCAQPEIVEHGVSGFLVDFENERRLGEWRWLYRKSDPEYGDAYWNEIDRLAVRMADSLSSAWENRCDYETMSAAAVDRAANRFGADRLTREIEQLYRFAD